LWSVWPRPISLVLSYHEAYRLSAGDLSAINSADFDDDDGGGRFTQV